MGKQRVAPRAGQKRARSGSPENGPKPQRNQKTSAKKESLKNQLPATQSDGKRRKTAGIDTERNVSDISIQFSSSANTHASADRGGRGFLTNTSVTTNKLDSKSSSSRSNNSINSIFLNNEANNELRNKSAADKSDSGDTPTQPAPNSSNKSELIGSLKAVPTLLAVNDDNEQMRDRWGDLPGMWRE
jgi:hypothetical protein